MKAFDFLIVGSGLFGSTFACCATRAGKRCLVIDKRSHLGGNVYCEPTSISADDGKCVINVHKYGAHIFHTNDREVWNWVNQFVEFNRFTNSPIANYRGKLYNLPFNMNTFYQMWGVSSAEEAKRMIEEQKKKLSQTLSQRAGNTEPANLEEQAISLVGEDIYKVLVKEYSEKQWGRDCKELPASIIRRLPLRFTFDNNYFDSRYQGIPIGGYNKLIKRMLEGAECHSSVDFFKDNIQKQDARPLAECWRDYADTLVYSGAIDEYFRYQLGRLNWRSVSYQTRVLDTPNYQGNAVMNFTSHDVPYTRIIEHKHFEQFGHHVYDSPGTIISEEYFSECQEGMEPYYPVNDQENELLSAQYHRLAVAEKDVIFGGRLADYQYHDMDQVIRNAMDAAASVLAKGARCQ